jgi:metallophosphoesterase superfamily enzyme
MLDTSRILIIGDIHCPFEHKDYLAHCKSVAKFYKTTHTVFIGDIMDGHAMSYHESDPDGHSGGAELDYTIEHLSKWHKAFPGADVIFGNHDRLVWRKVKTSGLSMRWAKKLGEVLEVPTWTFHHRLKLDGVLYIHGEGTTARTMAARAGCSVVQGHRHTEGYVWHLPTENPMFGMQVGCGVDADSYAMEYAKNCPPPVLACGVVLNHGKLPILMPMN